MPERLRRLDETFLELPIYFVTACTHKREPCLNNLDIHQRLTEFGKAGEERGAWLGAFVLMPDHLHAFVIVDDEQLKLSTWVKSLKNALSKVLREKDVPSPHWQKGFSITFYGAQTRTQKNGRTFARIPYERDWS